MKLILQFAVGLSLVASACGTSKTVATATGYPASSLVAASGDGAMCDPVGDDPVPGNVCEWFQGFDAVIGGVIKSVELVDYPHSSFANRAPVDDEPCTGSISPAMRFSLEVTHVYFGEVVLGATTVYMPASQVESMIPHVKRDSAGQLAWDSPTGKTAFETGTWVGLPVMRVEGRGYALVHELPFTATDVLVVNKRETCGYYPQPDGMSGMDYGDFVKMSSDCARSSSPIRDRRRQIVDEFPMYSYSARCYPVNVEPECVVEEDCGNGTTCVDAKCIPETAPPGPAE
ncbi:MAG: hypothetical protein IV100_28675 [Myxococcales bacterium]|nr:hypothetical protein [Myxococcales bacterium]